MISPPINDEFSSYPFFGLGTVFSHVIEIVWVSFVFMFFCIILHDDKKRDHREEEDQSEDLIKALKDEKKELGDQIKELRDWLKDLTVEVRVRVYG